VPARRSASWKEQAFRHAGVAFRPTIARGLALSAIYFFELFLSMKAATKMPTTQWVPMQLTH
jgi:hypothetical protein